ncbi:MAG: tRNA (adenosine(37)-N6)-threonylcarbamoyltransferase complex ATPase subunit type 1 TsaE, partial [Planctomycetes bacterium]|nr:tRNA (adenosine(37)-N6)-threonylcarbamoyltransferase complex ATPase subunit type 1 TsaE [Planctomycetota bacterium]
VGGLGAGKTTFIRGLARGLGVEDPMSVKSPSYTLVIDYPGTIPLLHIDAYFMKSEADLNLCGMEEALSSGKVVAIEWADRVFERLPGSTIMVTLDLLDLEQRGITIAAGSGP